MSMNVARLLVEKALDLLFPPRCPGCQRYGYLVCATCLRQIQPPPPPRCLLCDMPINHGYHCQQCWQRPLRLSGLRFFGYYDGPLKECIHALKYEGVTRLAPPLATFLAQTYRLNHLSADLLAPVPLHSERERRRGFNHAQLLAEACASSLNVPCYNHLLQRIRATPAQARLSADQRLQNVRGAFRYQKQKNISSIAGRSIILIDDVCTTGATLEACAEPLFQAGAASVWGLVLARPI